MIHKIRKMFIAVCAVIVAVLEFVYCETIVSCANISKDSSIPCVEIPECSSGSKSKIQISQLSNGLGQASSTSDIALCYTSNYLSAVVESSNQKYFPLADQFQACNDAVFNMDVVELFIAPSGSSDPYCYSEIDTSPYDMIFESGIYNPYLNHTGVSNYLIDCSSSHIRHDTTVDKQSHSWNWVVNIPWSVVNSSKGCPTYTKEVSATAGTVYRANMYRVNELTAVSTSCSSTTCEYMAWSPTYSNPPAFHEPTRFGYFLLV
jgi:hypothetical protein